jgi:TCP-1/cpn60 chaperonin family
MMKKKLFERKMSGVGLLSLLKEGSRHLSGQEEAVLKNIEACKALAATTRTSLGPNGMNKMVIDSRDNLFVTSDAATILKELEVVHPAAKLLVMATERQENEVCIFYIDKKKKKKKKKKKNKKKKKKKLLMTTNTTQRYI